MTMEMLVALSNVAPAGGEAVVLGGMTSDADSGEEELLLVVSAQILQPEAEGAAR